MSCSICLQKSRATPGPSRCAYGSNGKFSMSLIMASPPVRTAKVAIAVNIAKKAGAVKNQLSTDWRAYPFDLVPGDPQLRFPAAEGNHPDCESDTWFIAGELSAESGRQL